MKKRLVVALSSLFLAFISVFVPVALRGGFNVTKKADALNNSINTTYATYVGELWKGNGFDKKNVDKLLKFVSGNASASTDNFDIVDSLATSKRTSYQIKTSTVLGKTTNQDVIVKIGGLDWTVTYLSKDKNGNPILTLWLSNASQLNGKQYDTGKTFVNYGHAPMNSGFSCSNDVNVKYPDNMYGTSYMSSVVLNNGGEYSTSTGGATTSTHTQSEDNVFAPFTITTNDNSAIADFIVTPEDISWQESGQAGKYIWGYCYSNENWSKTTSNSGFYGSGYNYATKENSESWNNDRLWIPSTSEIGYSGDNQGIWGTSYYQREHENWFWVRSSYHTNAVNYIVQYSNTYSYAGANSTYGVRPAFHLDLNKVLEHIISGDGYVEELWDSNNQEIDKTNLNKLYAYLTGNENATYEDVLNIAKETKTSENFYQNSVMDKKESTNISIKFGGLDWSATYLSTDKNGNAILTMWLDYSSANSSFCSFSPSNGSTYSYPDNMYGSSYIRSVTLNNGGAYSTNNNGGSWGYITPQSNNIFAPFTMKQKEGINLVDYIVTPEFVSWQETGQFNGYVGYKLSNENWSKEEPDTNFYNYYYNFAKRPDNDAWKKDYVWLPSMTEVGYANSANGIWKTTNEQRIASTNFWLRSSYHSDHYRAYYVYQSGSDTTHSYANVNNGYGVRPALHFNLNVDKIENPEEITPKDESTYVKVDELWDSENNKIDSKNFKKLMQYVLDSEDYTYSNILNSAKSIKNSSDIRNNTINGKTSSQDIVVTLGGLEWTVTYLSTSIYEEPILTLWLNDSSLLSGKNYGTTQTFAENGTSSWNSSAIPHDALTASYPDNMYGTSFMNSVVLNNGGFYVTTTNSAGTTFNKRMDSAFAPFTIRETNENVIADYIVSPNSVSWQTTGQLAKTKLNTPYNFSNENLGSIGNDGFFTNIYPGNTYYNYQVKGYNSNWGNGLLWLPSLCETGYGSNENEGIWSLSDAQRSNVANYWLRTASAVNGFESCYITADGENYGNASINYFNAVRPALHFNLNMAYVATLETEKGESGYVKVDELWNKETQKMSDTSLDLLIKYLTGSEKNNYSDLVKLARETKNANDFRMISVGNKRNDQDIILTLGGLEWTTTYLSTDKDGNVVLTLWLASDYQSAWQGLAYKDNDLFGLKNGILQSKFSSWVSSSVSQYPDTMYGTSYIRAVTLNNGGTYSSNTSTANYASQNINSIFADFTMPIDGQYNDITDFLVTPLGISWQENQSFYNTYGQGNNYSNEAWRFNFPTTNFVSGTSYGDKIGNDLWKSDYLWLPSYTEVATIGNNSFWGLSSNQLHTFDEIFYLRSFSNVASNVYAYNGLTNEVKQSFVSVQNSVRPAMHLNLTAIFESLTEDESNDSSTVYLDTENGSDFNSGTSYLKPVKTIGKAEELVSRNGVIEIMSKVTVLDDVTLGKNKFYTLKRWEGAEYVAGYWGTLIQVGNYDNSRENNFANLTLNVVVNGNNTVNVNNLEDIYKLGIIGIDVNYGNLIFDKNSGIESFNNKLYTHIVYLRHSECEVTIKEGNFYAKNNLGNSIIYAQDVNSKIVINGGTFEGNKQQYIDKDNFASIIHGGNITIKNAKFINNFILQENIEDVNSSVIKLIASGVLKIEDSIFTSNVGNFGSVIYAENGSSVVISNSQFINNNVTNIGGVIYLSENNKLDVSNSSFVGNSAKAGGVISGLNGNNIKITKSFFSENNAYGVYSISETEYVGGGAILLRSNGNKVEITFTDFNNNKAEFGNGGAINLDGNSNKFNILSCNFYGNTAKDSGGSLYINNNSTSSNAEVEIRKCSFEKSTATKNGGAIYITDNVTAGIYESFFKNNSVIDTELGFGGAVRGGTSYNNNFENNYSANYGGALYNVDSFNSTFTANNAVIGGAMYGGNVVNSTFVDNSATKFGGAVYNPVSVSGAIFSNNKAGLSATETVEGFGGAIYSTLGLDSISNSIFTNNSATKFGGAVYISVENEDKQSLDIIDSEFTFNFSVRGSAIYNNGKLKLSLIGEVTITNNISSEFGAVYFVGSKENEGSTINIGNSSKVNNIYIYNNFIANSLDELERDKIGNLIGEVASNLYVDFEEGGEVDLVLKSNLVGGSKIGVAVNNFINEQNLKEDTTDEYYIIKFTTSTDIITLTTKNAFVSDDLENVDFYSSTIYNGTAKIGVGIFVKVIDENSRTIVYTASDYYGGYDGNEHTVDINVFVPAQNYTIFYGTEENGEFSTTPITVRDAGESVDVWFYIEATGFARTKKEKRSVAIDKMNIFYDDADININLWFNQTITTKSNNGTKINEFVTTNIIDEDGNAVACDFILYANSNITVNLTNTTNGYTLDIVPKNTEKYKSIVGVSVYPNVSYDSLYFNNGFFYPTKDELDKNESSTYKLDINTFNANIMLQYLVDNGVIFFTGSYSVSSNLSINIEKRFEFKRYNFSGAIFDIATNGSLKIETIENGNLIFTGEENSSNNTTSTAGIVNNGQLQIIGNVKFNALWNYNSNSQGGAIYSNGTLYLENISITNCVSLTNGGGISSSGTTTIINTRIENCKAQKGAGVFVTGNAELQNVDIYNNLGLNSSTADSTIVRGGGLYVSGTTSEIIILDSRINNNGFNFITVNSQGGGVFVENGKVTFENCDISYNNAYNGGGLYILSNSEVIGNNLRIESNTLQDGTSSAPNMGAGVFVDTKATFTLNTGLIRSNGTNKNSTTHNINGIGVFNKGTFNFATSGDKSSQITLNSDRASTLYGGGFVNNGIANIYGGYISQNYTSQGDSNCGDGTFSLGGTALFSGRIYFQGTNSILNVVDNWAEFNDPDNSSYLLSITIQGNRLSIRNPIIVKADDNFIPTWDEWQYISSKISMSTSLGTNIIAGSVRTLSYDAEKNEYIIYYKTPMEAGTGKYYLNPSTGNDLNAGTAVGTALKTWDGVLKKSKPGDTIFIGATWTISDYMDIDGEGRVLKRLETWGGLLIRITGSYNPTISIKNLILDGNKRKNNTVAEGTWASYLNANNLIIVSVSCSLNLNNVIFRNNNYSSGVFYTNASNSNIKVNMVNCEFLENTSYGNGTYATGFYISNTNTDFYLNLTNCVFRRNQRICTANTYYESPTCLYLAGSSSTSKVTSINFKNCVMDSNEVYNTGTGSPLTKLALFELSSFGENEKVYINFENCDITKNKDRTVLNKSQNASAAGIYIVCPNAYCEFNMINVNFSDNFEFYNGIRADFGTGKNVAKFNVEGCNFIDNQDFQYLFYIVNKAQTTFSDCVFNQQIKSYVIYLNNPTGCDLSFIDCEFYNTDSAIYTHQNANNVTVKNNKYISGLGAFFTSSTIGGKLLIENIYAKDSVRVVNFPGTAKGAIIKNVYAEDCYDGLYINAGKGIVTIEDVTIINARRYGIYSNNDWQNIREITAKNVKIQGVSDEGSALYLRYSDFYGDNVTIDSAHLAIDLMGGKVKNIKINNCNIGMNVYTDANSENHIENVTINNIRSKGIQYLYSSTARRLNTFKNVTISNCASEAFYDNTTYYANNLVFENCVFENSYRGYYRSFRNTQTYNNIDVTSFMNCIFRNNRYNGAYFSSYHNTSCNITSTYNVTGCLFENNNLGLYVYRANTYGKMPIINIDDETIVRNNSVGLYVSGETSQNWFTLTGGQYINNISYGVYSTCILTINPSTEGGVVIKNNGVNEYGNKLIKDVYAPSYYLQGSFDIESLMCGVATNGIYLTGSIAQANPVKVSIMGNQAVNSIVAQGNAGYVPTKEDYDNLLPTNWNFKIDSSSRLVLSGVSSSIDQGNNIYYFDPQRTILGSGAVPSDPITDWDILSEKLNEDTIVYVMSSFTVSKNIDAKNATFRFYINPTLANPAYYFTTGMFKVITGSVTISNIRIDGNSNINGFLSSSIGGGFSSFTSSLKLDIEGAIAYINGNSTLTVDNMYLFNLYCKNAFRLETGSNRLYLKNSIFEFCYPDSNGLIYSQGTYVEINNCNFRNSYNYIAYCDNSGSIQLKVSDTLVEKVSNGFYFSGSKISVDNVEARRVGAVFYLYNSTNSTSYINNCYAEDISMFVHIRANNSASYINLTNIEAVNVSSYGVYLDNIAKLKTITGNNIIIRNAVRAVDFYQQCNINLTNFQAINCQFGFGYTDAKAIPSVTIKLTDSKFIDNEYGFYYYFYTNSAYRLNLEMVDTIFENNTSSAIYIKSYSIQNYLQTPHTVKLTRVDIINCGIGVYLDFCMADILYCNIIGTTKGNAIYYQTYLGTNLDIHYCNITDTMSTQAVYLNGGRYSSYTHNVWIFYNNFSNNRYGSFHCTTDSVSINVYYSVFDKTSGSPYNNYTYCSIYAPSNCPINVWGKVVIDAGVYINPGSYNLKITGAMEEGSHIRIWMNRTGTYNAAIVHSTNTTYIANYTKYFHVDGWNVMASGNYIRLNYASSYMHIGGDPLEDGLTAVYFNPVSGNDDNHGFAYNYPVKTWERVEQLNVNNLPVYIMSQWNINKTTEIDGHGWTLYRYYENSSQVYLGSLFNVTGSGTVLTIKNLTIHGNRYGFRFGKPISTTSIYATAPIMKGAVNTTIILKDSSIMGAYTNYADSIVAVDTKGNFIAENCEFRDLFERANSNPSRIFDFSGDGSREISFVGCYFTLCRNAASGTVATTHLMEIKGSNANIYIADCLFEKNLMNASTNDNGLIFVTAENSSLVVNNTKFYMNANVPNYAMIFCIKVLSSNCDVEIIDCLFIENINKASAVLTRDGGSIYIDTNSKVEISYCEFENTYNNKGSGIYITSSVSCNNLDIDLYNLTFKNCYANVGGAIYVDTSSFAGGSILVNNINCYYVFASSAISINMNTSEITLENVMIDGGSFSNTAEVTNSGGIYVKGSGDSSISLLDVTLKNNVTKLSDMSSIEVDDENAEINISSLEIVNGVSENILFNIKGGNVLLSNSNFSYNKAFSVIGFEDNKLVNVIALNFQKNLGGYAIYSQSNVAGNHEIRDVNIINNSASGIYYGGHNYLDSVVTLNNIRVENNTNMLSGITVVTSKGTITNSVVKNNVLIGSALGGFNADLTVTYTDVLYNELVKEGNEFDVSCFVSRGVEMFVELPQDANYSSGGVSIVGGKAKVEHTNVIGNKSNYFGGGLVSVSPIIISHSVISGNSATEFGGGLVLTMDAEITNSTIKDNISGTNGGGIWFGALLNLTNVKLTGNKSNNGSAIYSYGEKTNIKIANSNIEKNTSYGDGGVYFVNDRGGVELLWVNFIGNTGFGKGAALYLNSLTFVESNIVFSGNNIYGTLINFENVANFEMSDFVVSGNYGYGENATLFSFTTAQESSSRMLFRDGRIYGNKMEFNASVVIDDGLYIRMTNVEVTGNSNLYSGADLTTDNGKGGAIFVKNGTLVLEDGLAVDNWAEYGAWLFIGPKGKAVISSQEISNISTDAETTINGVIYVEKNGELEFHNCKILGISLGSLKGAVNNNGHTVIVDSAIYDNNTENSIIYNGKTGVISLEGVDIYSNSSTNGGAIYNLGIINFVSGKIRDNSASLGGAIYNEGDFTLSGGQIVGNTATSGAGIYNKGKIIISGGSIECNLASTSGAGIYNDKDASLTMKGGEISQNTKTESGTSILGSGIANYGSLYIYGGTISNNGSNETGNGGGIYAGADSYNYIENARIINNLASNVLSGANIYLSANSYALIKNTEIISGRESDSNSVMDIFATNAILIFDNVTLRSSVNSGTLRAENSNVTIQNSYISGLKPSVDGVSFYIQSGNLLINNATIENTSLSSVGVMYIDNLISFDLANSNFVNNETRAIYIDVSKVATRINIENSVFSGNSVTGNGGALYVIGSSSKKVTANILIKTSSFTSNIASENGGAIYLGSAQGVVVELYDTTLGGFIDTNNNGIYDDFDSMVGNFARTGGAIYIESENPASLILKGEVTITYNKSTTGGGGIYYAFSGETNYDENIFGLSMQSGAIIVIKNNYTNSTQTSVSTRDENNLHLTKDSNKGFLVAELSGNSKIGLTIDDAEESLIVVTTYKNDIPVTTSDLKVFSYDAIYDYSLKLDAVRNAIILVSNPDTNDEMIVIVSDKVYTMDGKPKTITAEDFTVYNCRNYTIYFAETEDGEYKETAPSYIEIKDYTIYYKVVDNYNEDNFVSGSINFRITGRILSIVEAPVTYINSGDRLSLARFVGGIVKSGDLVVSGTWAFEEANTIPSDINTKYVLKFTPSDQAIYENMVSVLVSPTISFSKVYFSNDRFYNDVECTSFTGISSLADMVKYLSDGGEIYFMSSYIVGGNGILEESVMANKKVFLYRHQSFTNGPVISIPTNTNIIRFTLGGGIGSIHITSSGNSNVKATEPFFSNAGILSINNNVYISNITNTGGGPAVAHNFEGATLNLNGCSIFNTYVDINTVLLTGGSIYNEGNLIVNGGDYRLNYSVNGNGGFIYNTGTVTINSGLFARNYTINGSGGCIYTKGGSVIFNGGEFIGNSANYGGVICIDEQGDAIINGANFYSNVANVEGASIFTISGNVIQNGGDFKFNVNLGLKNNKDNNLSNNKSNNIFYLILVLSIIGIISTFLFVYFKGINKNINKLKNKN